MKLSGIKSGSKIRLFKEFSTTSQNSWTKSKTYPKNLVLSLVSFHVTKYGPTIILQVIRAKSVIAKYYSEISPEDYHSSYSWSKEKGYRIIRLYGSDAQKFIDEADYCTFTEEYKELTNTKK